MLAGASHSNPKDFEVALDMGGGCWCTVHKMLQHCRAPHARPGTPGSAAWLQLCRRCPGRALKNPRLPSGLEKTEEARCLLGGHPGE